MPTNQSYFLTYRPRTFSELDSSLAREQLSKVFASGKIPHAFLFTGTKGIGKTSAARIVARAVNCERLVESRIKNQELSDYEPCNECPTCLAITNGSCLDVLEIDAASNRGIDDIKDLREKIKLAPSSCRKKVYIIDEVHMLTTEAFNALLKTLEEPPAHALFVLCTTDPEKLPKTIVSRCQNINFQKATEAEVIGRLKAICSLEQLDFEEAALVEISKHTEGSFRDAVKMLEQVAYSGKITVDGVRLVIGLGAGSDTNDLLKLLAAKDLAGAFGWIAKANAKGVNFKTICEVSVGQLRSWLLGMVGVGNEALPEGICLTFEEIKTLVVLLSRAYTEVKHAIVPQLPLEMAVLEFLSGSVTNTVEQGPLGSEKSASVPTLEGKTQKTVLVNQATVMVRSLTSVPEEVPVANCPVNYTVETVSEKWGQIMEGVKPLNHSVGAFLRVARPVAVENGFLIVEVFYKFHKEQLETAKCRQIFEGVASGVLGGPVRVRLVLAERKIADPIPASLPDIIVPFAKVGTPVTLAKPIEKEADIISLAENIFNGGGSIQ